MIFSTKKVPSYAQHPILMARTFELAYFPNYRNGKGGKADGIQGLERFSG
jgi:superoxide dismutase